MQRIFVIRPGVVADVLPTVYPYLEEMANRTNGRFTVDDIAKRAMEPGCNLWITLDVKGEPNGAIITKVEQYPRVRMLNMLYMAGETGLMADFDSEFNTAVEEFAKFNHCAGVEFGGRSGWKKYVEPYGFKLQSVAYEKRFA